MRKIIQAAALIMALLPSALLAQDFEAGILAYDAGDYETALKEWRPLAEQGYASAQFNLGLMYNNGLGVPQDDAEAVKWYRLAAKQGDADAQFFLGWMYGQGKGVPQDDVEAVKWYRLAAEQGYAKAQYNLGVMYDQGEGVAQDYVRAHMWANIAAANGAENAQKLRDLIAAKMTSSDIATAQKMARACLESGYKNCGF